MTALISYHTYSGNTEEIAQLIARKLQQSGIQTDMHRIGIDSYRDPAEYSYFFLGTFTWDYGRTPEEVKDYIAEIGYKPKHVAIFGSGDTQFGGDELFCKALDRLHTFYESKWPVLKIEQSPRGKQEQKISTWVEGVVQSG